MEHLFVTTSDTQRAALWLSLFGAEYLPIMAPRPRLQEHPGVDFPILAYDLDLGRLSAPQRQRFAGHLSRRYGIEYTAVLARVETAVSWPIKAGPDIQVMQPEVDDPAPAVFAPGRRQKPRPTQLPLFSRPVPAGRF